MREPNKMSFEQIREEVLAIVAANPDYFSKHPKQLCFTMALWNNMVYATRIAGHGGHENPKDEVMEIEEQNEEYGKLVYDAWSYQMDWVAERSTRNMMGAHTLEDFDRLRNNFLSFDKEFVEIGLKLNKDADEMFKYLSSKCFPYCTLYPEQFQFICLLLHGSGEYGWNGDGYLFDVGPSDMNGALYFGWQTCTLDSYHDDTIKNRLRDIFTSDKVSNLFSEAKEKRTASIRRELEKRRNELIQNAMIMSLDKKIRDFMPLVKGMDEEYLRQLIEVKKLPQEEVDGYLAIIDKYRNADIFDLDDMAHEEYVKNTFAGGIKFNLPTEGLFSMDSHGLAFKIPDNVHDSYLRYILVGINSIVEDEAKYMAQDGYYQQTFKNAKEWKEKFMPLLQDRNLA